MGARFSSSLKPFLSRQTHGTGDDEGGEDFQQIILRFLLAPFEDEFIEPVRKERQDGDDRPALDDDVEEIALARQPMLGDEQMAGGRNGNEFGDPLDDPQNDGDNPVRHGVFRHETGAQGKEESNARPISFSTEERLAAHRLTLSWPSRLLRVFCGLLLGGRFRVLLFFLSRRVISLGGL